MSEIKFQINGTEVKAKEGMSVLDAAREAGISIPTLCHHEKLIPFGGCRLCLVELDQQGWKKMVVSCVYPAENNLVVTTHNEKINRIRKTLLELLLSHAPGSKELNELAVEYGASSKTFEQDASFCVHCGLCVRYCAEIKKLNAVGFIDRGRKKEICFIPEIAGKECKTCMECFPLCPTSYLQAAFVLVEELAFPVKK